MWNLMATPERILWINFACGIAAGVALHWYHRGAQRPSSKKSPRKNVPAIAVSEADLSVPRSMRGSMESVGEANFQAALSAAVSGASTLPSADESLNGGRNPALPLVNVETPALSAGLPTLTGAAVGPGAAAGSVLNQVNDEFQVSTAKLHSLVRAFIAEYQKGLLAENHTLKMLPAFVKRPTGSETGTFLSLDLGGTNLRVGEVVLGGNGQIRSSGQKFTVADSVKSGTGDELFSFIADCVGQFLDARQLQPAEGDSVIQAGLTFSFPCRQTSLREGYLLLWHKGYQCSGVLQKNVVELMNQAFEQRGVPVRVVALVNDAVATLLSAAYTNPECMIGVILGTGTNAAYVEEVDQIAKLTTHEHNASQTTPEIPYSPLRSSGVPPSPVNPPPRTMVINTEWGAFDNRRVILPITPYDNQLDRHSTSPGIQIFEKMVAGMFVGELCRLVFLDLIKAGELFNGVVPQSLETRNSFLTAYMSRIGRDHTDELMDTKLVLEGLLDIRETTAMDRRIVKRICALVGIRAARLAACAIAALVIKINKLSGCTVAVDGTLYEFYPHFRSHIRDALSELLGISADKINLVAAKDGSATGSAVAAALAEGAFPGTQSVSAGPSSPGSVSGALFRR